MKTIGIILGMFLFALASCTNNGNSAKTGDAQEVEVKSASDKLSYTTVASTSHLVWRGSHLGGVQKRHGKVSILSAEAHIVDGEVSNATVLIDMASVTVANFDEQEQNDKLAGHLKTGDFFNVEKFPTAKFELTGIVEAAGDFNSVITGNLTILEAVKSITFKANISVTGASVAIQSEDFSVDRTDWGLVYNVEGSEGVPVDYLIANDMGFTIDVTINK